MLRCCRDIRRELLCLTETLSGVKVLGPAPLPVARMNKAWRYRVTVSGPEGKPLRAAVSWVLMNGNNGKKYKGVSVYADYDPLE
ncbi:MAG: hypothetical protein LUH42_07620 [Oscillospiraceae bacterium]|nr:hypothetical protein [Oscillospiraceae bacterium]